MMKDLPRPDISRFSPISPEVVTLDYLGLARRALSPSTLKSRLSAFVNPGLVDVAIASLVADGQATVEKTITLTKIGWPRPHISVRKFHLECAGVALIGINGVGQVNARWRRKSHHRNGNAEQIGAPTVFRSVGGLGEGEKDRSPHDS